MRVFCGVMVCAGIACSVSGAAVAGVMNSKTGNKENPVLGNIFFGLQCFFGSMFFLLQKSVLNRYPPLQTTAWGALHHTLMRNTFSGSIHIIVLPLVVL